MTRKLWTLAMAVPILAGCLISEDPLIQGDDSVVVPFPTGDRVYCTYTRNDQSNGNCRQAEISVTRSNEYVVEPRRVPFLPSNSIHARFHPLADDAWVAQIEDTANTEDFQYFIAKKTSGKFVLRRIHCNNLDESERDDLASADKLEIVDESDSDPTCKVTSLADLVEIAKLYQAGSRSDNETVEIR